jgi:hypothetical protein
MLFLFGINFAHAQFIEAPLGATVEFDQKVYSWTDKVYITIVAPDHNLDSNLIDQIGDTDFNPIKISTRGSVLDNYKLVETGIDTGIFTGEIILTGFTSHDADGDGSTGDASGAFFGDHGGPTDGLLPLSHFIPTPDGIDGITASFEFQEDETVVGSSLINWNEGEIQWLESYNVSDGTTNVVRVIDPDLNLNPLIIDSFDIDVWSDSDAGGINLTVTETNIATGIFEGTVLFTTTDASDNNRIRVAEGDTVTAEYEDNTLPFPYTIDDELDIIANLIPVDLVELSVITDKSTYESGESITITGTANQIISPVWKNVSVSNMRAVDAFGNNVSSISVDQQVQITMDVANGKDNEQPFAYLVQIQDSNNSLVSLAWITGTLSTGQSFSPALSWIPTDTGSYFGKILIWNNVDDVAPLADTTTFTLNVNNGLSAFEDVSITNYTETPLSLKILNPQGNVIQIDQIPIQNEKFSVVYTSQGTFWEKPGIYEVIVQELDKKATTTFDLNIAPKITPPIVCPTGQKLVGNTCQTITCPTGQKLVGNTCQTITCPTGQKLVGNTCAEIDKPIPVEIILAVGASAAVGAGSAVAYKLYHKKPDDIILGSTISVEIRGGLEE